jgi:hypothetical protein
LNDKIVRRGNGRILLRFDPCQPVSGGCKDCGVGRNTFGACESSDFLRRSITDGTVGDVDR